MKNNISVVLVKVIVLEKLIFKWMDWIWIITN